MNRNIVLGILLTLSSIIISNSNLYTNHIVYAHNFSITYDSALLTLIEQIKAETELVNAYFLASNSISAIEHAKNAANLTNGLNDKLRQSTVADITQIYNNGLYNSKTRALVVAHLVDEILRNYGSAYGITYDLTNMSNMMMAMTLQSIKDLKYAIDNKIRAEALMEIVHMKIHPMLQSAYDLKLVVR